MNEHAYTFGTHGNLLGILCEPEVLRDGPTVILLNAGLVHRIGPFRMSVDLARRLAELGYSTLRMDLSGLGDSAARPDEPDLGHCVEKDVREAMDFLAQKRGCDRFVVGGMCTGAINAHRVAVADARAVGVIMLDGYAYPTAQFFLRRYGPALLSPARVWRALGRMGRHLLSPKPGDGVPSAVEDEILSDEFPTRASVAADLRQLMARETALFFAYSGNWYLYFNYAQQIRDNFPDVPFGDRLCVEYFPEADHTYTLLADRQRLFERVTSWMQQHFA